MYLIGSLTSKVEIYFIVFNEGALKALSINASASTYVITQKIGLVTSVNRKIILNILYARSAVTKR